MLGPRGVRACEDVCDGGGLGASVGQLREGWGCERVPVVEAILVPSTAVVREVAEGTSPITTVLGTRASAQLAS